MAQPMETVSTLQTFSPCPADKAEVCPRLESWPSAASAALAMSAHVSDGS